MPKKIGVSSHIHDGGVGVPFLNRVKRRQKSRWMKYSPSKKVTVNMDNRLIFFSHPNSMIDDQNFLLLLPVVYQFAKLFWHFFGNPEVFLSVTDSQLMPYCI